MMKHPLYQRFLLAIDDFTQQPRQRLFGIVELFNRNFAAKGYLEKYKSHRPNVSLITVDAILVFRRTTV